MWLSRFHPFTYLCVWFGFVLAVQTSPAHRLPVFVAVALLLALQTDFRRWLKLVRRTRWITLSLLLVFGYATPGVALWDAWGVWSPTYQGLEEGLIQLGRIHCALAALSAVLSVLTVPQLMAGLYVMAFPLKYILISRERLVVRLALTLEYAERTLSEQSFRSPAEFKALFERDESSAGMIELPIGKPGAWDLFALSFLGGALWAVWR